MFGYEIKKFEKLFDDDNCKVWQGYNKQGAKVEIYEHDDHYAFLVTKNAVMIADFSIDKPK